jgi:hypothetical protein
MCPLGRHSGYVLLVITVFLKFRFSLSGVRFDHWWPCAFCSSVFSFVHVCGDNVLLNSITVSAVGILNYKWPASNEEFLDDYEISPLVCDSDDSEDDRDSYDDWTNWFRR